MLYPNGNVEDSQKLNELVSLENQVKVVRLQDNLDKQNFHEDMKTVLERVTKSIKDVFENLTKTITETSINNNKAIENLNNKLLEIMRDRGILASYLTSPLSKTTNLEYSIQFKLVKDSSSNRIIDLLINKTTPIRLYNILLTFRDTGKVFELQGDVLKMITNENYIVDLASLPDKKLKNEFAKEMNIQLKAQGKTSTRDSTLIKLLESPG